MLGFVDKRRHLLLTSLGTIGVLQMARLARVIAFAFALVLSRLPASAQDKAGDKPEVLTKVTLEDIRDALQNAGYRGQIKNDSTGEYVSSASGGQNFFVSLGGCDDQKVCKTLLAETAGWTPKTPLTVDGLDAFDWDNAGWLTVVKYKDGKSYANSRVTLVGGVTKAWLQSNLEGFATTTENFAAFMQK